MTVNSIITAMCLTSVLAARKSQESYFVLDKRKGGDDCLKLLLARGKITILLCDRNVDNKLLNNDVHAERGLEFMHIAYSMHI